MPLWRGGPNTRTLPTVLLTPSASTAADMAHLCVPQNQALGVCRGFAPDIQICGTHGRKNLVNATIISNEEEEEAKLYMVNNMSCHYCKLLDEHIAYNQSCCVDQIRGVQNFRHSNITLEVSSVCFQSILECVLIRALRRSIKKKKRKKKVSL